MRVNGRPVQGLFAAFALCLLQTGAGRPQRIPIGLKAAKMMDGWSGKFDKSDVTFCHQFRNIVWLQITLSIRTGPGCRLRLRLGVTPIENIE